MAPILASCLALGSTGCAVAFGSAVLPSRTVPVGISEQHETVFIESEPSGASVTKNGAVLGTTPTKIDLTYQAEEYRHETAACWTFVPLVGIDLAIAAAGAWASYAYLLPSDAGKSVCSVGEDEKSCMPAVAVVGMIVSAVYAWYAVEAASDELSSGCQRGSAPAHIMPQRHALRLTRDGWEEKLDIEAPTPPGSPAVEVVFRAKEAADWEHALASNSDEVCRKYLEDYPNGRWRKDAKQRIEELAWRGASREDDALGYWGYLSQYPSGRWKTHAERGLIGAVEEKPEALRWDTLAEMLVGKNDAARSLAVSTALQRNSVSDLQAMLLDREIAVKKRRLIIDGLGQAAASSSHSQRARTVLCGFASTERYVAGKILPDPPGERLSASERRARYSRGWLNFWGREFADLPDEEKRRLRPRCTETKPPQSTFVIHEYGKRVIESSPCASLAGPGGNQDQFDICWRRYQTQRLRQCHEDALDTAMRVFPPENALMDRAHAAGRCGK